MGLVSPGGVHSHQDQIAALAELLAEAGIEVAVHAFLDGRDTPPRSALDYLKDFQVKAPRRPSPPCPGATTRWTATSGGHGSRKPIARWSKQRASTPAMPLRPWSRAMPPDPATSSDRRRDV